MSLFSVTAGIRNKIWSVLSMNIRTWILLVMQGLILLCMTCSCTYRPQGRPAKHGKQLSVETDFTFSGEKSVITIPVSAVSLPESLAIRKFWLMSQPQKKSMVKTPVFSTIFPEELQIFCAWQEKAPLNQTGSDWMKYIPLFLYSFRWNIETSDYEQKTFWSFCSYMVRSCKGIEMLVNLINISYCAMKLLPYQDKTFSEYRTKSVQEFRFELSQGIRRQIFFCHFRQKCRNTHKNKCCEKALNRLIHQQVYHL